MFRRSAWVATACAGMLWQLSATPAIAAPLHDAAGCAAAVPVGADGVLAIESDARFHLYATWEPDVYSDADRPPFALKLRATQAAGCADSETFGVPPHAMHWWKSGQHVLTDGVSRISLVGARMQVVYDHPGVIDGAGGTRLDVGRSTVELHTSASWRAVKRGSDPARPLTIRALSTSELDVTGDGVADIVISDPVGTVFELVGTAHADVVDVASLDPRVCLRGRLAGGDDEFTAPQQATDPVVDCGDTSWIHLGEGDDRFTGGPGVDRVCDAKGALVATLGAGDDEFRCVDDRLGDWKLGPPTPNVPRTIDAGVGDDVVISTWGRNHVRGGAGDDQVRTGRRDDVILGGPGDDRLYPDAGRDRVFAQAGNDAIIDEAWSSLAPSLRGHDLLVGGPGHDLIYGNFGSDHMIGGPGRDRLWARGGGLRPRLVGGPGNDIIETYRNRATVLGGPGRDYVETSRALGGRIDAGPGPDVLWLRVERGHEHATAFTCGTGSDWLYTAPRTHPSCERQRYCRNRAPRGECGRIPWGRRSIMDLIPSQEGIGPD